MSTNNVSFGLQIRKISYPSANHAFLYKSGVKEVYISRIFFFFFFFFFDEIDCI